jgi:serine/threonine protein kinase
MCGCFRSVLTPTSGLLSLGDISVLKQSKLAEGAYGDVWKCKSTKEDCIYALKEIKLQNRELMKMYEKEARILVSG